MTYFEPGKLSISAGLLAPTPQPDTDDGTDEESSDSELRVVVIAEKAHGERIDRALAGAVSEFSRSYLQQLIEGGAVALDGVLVQKASHRVKAGQVLHIELKPTPQSQSFKPELMVLDVVFEDAYLLVVNKPAGLVVHPAPGNWSATLLNGLLARGPEASFLPRAGIVHRLDKDTSGLMVVAKQRQTMDQLVALIAAREVSRDYLAIAHGGWVGASHRSVDLPVGRDPRNRLRMAVVDLSKNAGKLASTTLNVVQSLGDVCLVRCKLHTGRTHQIRVHLAHIGHPLVADETYGGRLALGMTRQALHACRLAFIHPVEGTELVFKVAPPADMQSAMNVHGLSYT